MILNQFYTQLFFADPSQYEDFSRKFIESTLLISYKTYNERFCFISFVKNTSSREFQVENKPLRNEDIADEKTHDFQNFTSKKNITKEWEGIHTNSDEEYYFSVYLIFNKVQSII